MKEDDVALHPAIEAKLEVAAEDAARTARRIVDLARSMDKLIEDLDSQDLDGDGVPDGETFDDPSEVRHVNELKVEAARVRRESDKPATYAIGARANFRR